MQEPAWSCATTAMKCRQAPGSRSLAMPRGSPLTRSCVPQAQQLLDLGDFSYWRITPVTLRFIAGFGAIRWVSGSEFAPPQALAQVEADIVAHMNAGLADTLRACCRGVLGCEVNEAVTLGVDCDGFDVRADGVRLRFDFPETAPDAESVQRAVVEMGRDARTL